MVLHIGGRVTNIDRVARRSHLRCFSEAGVLLPEVFLETLQAAPFGFGNGDPDKHQGEATGEGDQQESVGAEHGDESWEDERDKRISHLQDQDGESYWQRRAGQGGKLSSIGVKWKCPMTKSRAPLSTPVSQPKSRPSKVAMTATAPRRRLYGPSLEAGE
jgi:hypothetical protein